MKVHPTFQSITVQLLFPRWRCTSPTPSSPGHADVPASLHTREQFPLAQAPTAVSKQSQRHRSCTLQLACVQKQSKELLCWPGEQATAGVACEVASRSLRFRFQILRPGRITKPAAHESARQRGIRSNEVMVIPALEASVGSAAEPDGDAAALWPWIERDLQGAPPKARSVTTQDKVSDSDEL